MDKPDGICAAGAKDFYLQEYECLRKEIDWLLQDYRSLERNVVVAVGVTWGFLFKLDHTPPKWSWFIPCLFAALGALRASGIVQSFRLFHEYIERLEDAFHSPHDPGGWQHFTSGRTWSGRSGFLFWLTLLLATIAVGPYACFPYSPTARVIQG